MAWQNDNKVCFLRMEGRLFGDVPMNIELRLSVEDSPNSAGVAIDAIRCAKLGARPRPRRPARGPVVVLHEAPARAGDDDDEAWRRTEAFIRGERVTRAQLRQRAGLLAAQVAGAVPASGSCRA